MLKAFIAVAAPAALTAPIGLSRRATALPGRDERRGVWGPFRGPPCRSDVQAHEGVAERAELAGHVRLSAPVPLPTLHLLPATAVAGEGAPLPDPTVDNHAHVFLARELPGEVVVEVRLQARDDEEVGDHGNFF